MFVSEFGARFQQRQTLIWLPFGKIKNALLAAIFINVAYVSKTFPD